MKELEQKAERAAFEHTVFMALADIYTRLNPNVETQDYLAQLSANKEAEKNRILNRFIHKED